MVNEIIWSKFDGISGRDVYDILALRSSIFVVEQACAFLDPDGRDLLEDTEHAWISGDAAIGEPRILSYLRVFGDADAFKISRVVTASSARGRGLAANLMQSTLERYRDHDLVLDAQSRIEDWYVQFGFQPDGNRFLEDDIEHTPMRLRPAQA